ncbi:MAG TPA: hypothetical protein VM432_11780 [Bdellovibrionales bacterium]|nr:hypothetical protein [Bdellovibrionales bacterium]
MVSNDAQIYFEGIENRHEYTKQIQQIVRAVSETPVGGYRENKLTPVTLAGVIAPWTEKMASGQTSDYKLVCLSGMEYFIVADSEWREVLARYCWDEVKVIGLLNLSDMTLIPQKVYPRGPTGEKENVIDLAAWKSRDLIKKAFKNINDLIFIPAAVYAVMA